MNMYQRYAFVREKLKELEIEQEELEAKIVEKVKQLAGPYKTKFGTFTTASRISWKYSKAVELAKKGILEIQKEEQKNGLAEKEEKVGLRWIDPEKTKAMEQGGKL
jgi:hypothetical protein